MGEVYRAEDADLARVVAVKLLVGPLRRRRRDPRPLHARGARRRPALARAEHGHDLRRRRARRPAVHRDGVPRRAARSPTGSRAKARSRRLARSTGSAGSGRARRGARERRSSIATSSPRTCCSTSDDRVKVADFGVASAAGLGSFTEAGTVVGTAGYLAPEQARGERATPASDRYALARRRLRAPHGQAAVRARVHDRRGDRARARADPAGVATRTRSLPRELDDVLARGLAKEPEHRFGSAADARRRAARRARPRRPETTQVAARPRRRPGPDRERRVPLAARARCSARSPSPACSPPPCSPATTRAAGRPRHDRAADGARDGHAAGHDRRPRPCTTAAEPPPATTTAEDARPRRARPS